MGFFLLSSLSLSFSYLQNRPPARPPARTPARFARHTTPHTHRTISQSIISYISIRCATYFILFYYIRIGYFTYYSSFLFFFWGGCVGGVRWGGEGMGRAPRVVVPFRWRCASAIAGLHMSLRFRPAFFPGAGRLALDSAVPPRVSTHTAQPRGPRALGSRTTTCGAATRRLDVDTPGRTPTHHPPPTRTHHHTQHTHTCSLSWLYNVLSTGVIWFLGLSCMSHMVCLFCSVIIHVCRVVKTRTERSAKMNGNEMKLKLHNYCTLTCARRARISCFHTICVHPARLCFHGFIYSVCSHRGAFLRRDSENK
ncbi:hypothetical protein C8J57DRAFT_340883 [Mycena rebaudengoi]|nr:hypothetical protein C8J57DRAFT_340883 [Mycena rebaudengoi]